MFVTGVGGSGGCRSRCRGHGHGASLVADLHVGACVETLPVGHIRRSLRLSPRRRPNCCLKERNTCNVDGS